MIVKSLNSDFVSTKQAAVKLGVSVGTVQKMVENQILQAWKTAGGHRRISLSSLIEYLKKINVTPLSLNLTIYIVEDDINTAKLYEKTIKSWDMPVETVNCASGIECVYELSKNIADLIITDLKMDRMNGFELIKLLKSTPKFKDISTLVVTGLDIDEVKNLLPANIPILKKPIPFHEIHGFVTALHTLKMNTIG